MELELQMSGGCVKALLHGLNAHIKYLNCVTDFTVVLIFGM
jgi:hypothetical protein